MNLAIIGSRDFEDYESAKRTFLYFFKNKKITKIISGGARGADKIGAKLAAEFNIELVEHIPDWDGLGKVAGFVRNKKIIDDCDVVLAFFDGSSHGTQDSLDYAKEKKKITIIRYF